jgi:hypothetical protein
MDGHVARKEETGIIKIINITIKSKPYGRLNMI